MDPEYGTQQLLVLRRTTRAIADHLRNEMVGHLTTLAPLLRPPLVFGDFVRGGARILQRGPEAAFKELIALYQAIAPKPPFNLELEAKAPLDLDGRSLEMLPVQYAHQAQAGARRKTIAITSPLRWMLGYADSGIEALRALVADPNRDRVELQRVLLHVLALHVVATRQTGLARVLEALHLPLSAGRLPDLGEVPVTYVSSIVPTVRPPDEVLIENTEISGTDSFQEVADVGAIEVLRDPFREVLVEIVRSHAAPAATGS